MAKRKSSLKLAGREQWLATVAVVIVLLCGADYFVLRPILRRLNDLDTQTRQVREEVIYNAKILRQKDQVDSEWRGVQDKLKQTSTPQMHQTEMVAIIDKLASDAGLTLPKLAEGDVGPLVSGRGSMAETLVEYVVNVESEGPLVPLIEFLHGIQDHSGVVRVRRMTLAPKGKPEANVTRGSIEITRVLAE